MKEKHYKNELSAFVNQELTKDERQAIAEHLLLCEDCRREHDAIKFGALLADTLSRTDAPVAMWANLSDKLDGRSATQMGLIPEPLFNFRKALAFAMAMIVVSVLSILVYVSLFTGDAPNSVQTTKDQPQAADTQRAVNTTVPNESASFADSNTQASLPELASWRVETIAGMPRIDEAAGSGSIAVGQLLETDARSRARIEVADIGTVDIGANSRVKLVGTGKDEHRLSLERGKLHAKIFAPPRLFVVDTPSGKAVDLGCEYTLEVDKQGNSILHVTSGFVALEHGGRESIVPAGMMCMMRGKGLGTPFSAETSPTLRRAVEQFDFSNGGSKSIGTIANQADFYDMFTLWHLLSRVSKNDRGAVFDALSQQVKPPAGVTREGIEKLDKEMIEKWKTAVENAWFE